MQQETGKDVPVNMIEIHIETNFWTGVGRPLHCIHSFGSFCLSQMEKGGLAMFGLL